VHFSVCMGFKRCLNQTTDRLPVRLSIGALLFSGSSTSIGFYIVDKDETNVKTCYRTLPLKQ
jgi:hypothetical protein